MIEGRKNVSAWFEQTGKPYWIIYHKGKVESGNPSYRSDEREGVTNTDALGELKKILQIIGRGAYTIIASDKAQITAKGTYREDFEISVTESQDSAAVSGVASGAAVTTGFTMEDVKKAAQEASREAVESYKRERELEDLRKENAELKKDVKELEKAKNDPWNKVMTAIAPHAEPIISGFMGRPTAQVAGLPANDKLEDNNALEETDLTPEQVEQLSYVCSVFAKHDPDWLNTLNKMADKLEENPQLLNMIKSFI